MEVVDNEINNCNNNNSAMCDNDNNNTVEIRIPWLEQQNPIGGATAFMSVFLFIQMHLVMVGCSAAPKIGVFVLLLSSWFC
jgi:hypothetical protein